MCDSEHCTVCVALEYVHMCKREGAVLCEREGAVLCERECAVLSMPFAACTSTGICV